MWPIYVFLYNNDIHAGFCLGSASSCHSLPSYQGKNVVKNLTRHVFFFVFLSLQQLFSPVIVLSPAHRAVSPRLYVCKVVTIPQMEKKKDRFSSSLLHKQP